MFRHVYALSVLMCAVLLVPTQPEQEATQLLCVSNRAGNADIFLINADGTGPVNLTKHKADDTFPAWSPDGKQIAFTSDRDGVLQLYVMNADGSNVRRLVESNTDDRAPAWSPDGKKIAFTRDDGNSEIYVVGADGTGATNLTKTNAYDADAAWSPDGKQIAFASNRGGDGFQVFVMDADGSNVRALSETPNPLGYVYPAWSPDGKKILFSDVGANALELFATEPPGGKKSQVTRLGGANAQVAWSPGGRRLAFLHVNAEDFMAGVASLYVSAADGSGEKEILKGEVPMEGGRPAWRPKPAR